MDKASKKKRPAVSEPDKTYEQMDFAQVYITSIFLFSFNEMSY